MNEKDISQIAAELEMQALKGLNFSTDTDRDEVSELETIKEIDSLTEKVIAKVNDALNDINLISIKDILSVVRLVNNDLLMQYFEKKSDFKKIAELKKIEAQLVPLLVKEVGTGDRIRLIVENPTERLEFFELVCGYVLAGHYESDVLGPLRIALHRLPVERYSSTTVTRKYLNVKIQGMLRKIASSMEGRGMEQEMVEEFRNYGRYDEDVEKKID